MARMKEQIKTQEKELNKMEISNLSDAEFKTLVIRMLKELCEDLSSTKKIQSEIKDTLIEIRNNLQGNNNRVDETENQINDVEHKEAKKHQTEQEAKKRIPQNEDSVSSLWDNFKHHSDARRSLVCVPVNFAPYCSSRVLPLIYFRGKGKR